ncbi:MAG: hypothetical protein J6B77_02935 [Clostridia bacterium]|nr:hypothetical protein [Clostridia bacterium]
MAFAKDKFWMFGVRPHQDDIWLKPAAGPKPSYRYRSRITPAEGAMMLRTPNMLMINCEGEPVPYSEDAYGYAESFCRMKKVVWGGTGSGGFRIGNEEKFICHLAEKYPNIAGEYLDDFSSAFRDCPDKAERSVALLREIRAGLDKVPRPMELFVTWYWHEDPYPGMEQYVDVFTFWTWKSDEIPLLPERFLRAEPKYKGKKILLGIYMYDFSARKPVSVEHMELQCSYALELMKEGRIDGMIFETNSVMGIGLESELWLRDWVERVKDTVVPD